MGAAVDAINAQRAVAVLATIRAVSVRGEVAGVGADLKREAAKNQTAGGFPHRAGPDFSSGRRLGSRCETFTLVCERLGVRSLCVCVNVNVCCVWFHKQDLRPPKHDGLYRLE